MYPQVDFLFISFFLVIHTMQSFNQYFYNNKKSFRSMVALYIESVILTIFYL